MSNNFHTPTPDLAAGSTARAADVNDKFDAVEVGFDNAEAVIDLAIKLPVGSGNQQITETAPNRASKEVGFDANGDLALISSAFQWKGDWVTATAYIKNDVVVDQSTKNIYHVTADYTSGASVSVDVAASDLALMVNVSDIETAKTAAETAETNAETAQAAAELAETNAETAETNAETAETNASGSATTAATEATNASTSATNAATSATSASTSATNAATSETNAATSATSSATSATNSATSATNAASSATAASSSATAAAGSATSASTSATNAATSATSASTAETNAETAETNAETAQASAETAQTAAEAAQSAAEAVFDNFDDRYLGAKASAPTLDNDGNALIDGAMYYDTTLNITKIYDLGTTTWNRTTPTTAEQATINIVSGISANVTTVAGKATEVGRLGTADAVSDMNTLAVTAIIDDMDTVAGISGNVTTVAGVSSDVTTVADNDARITILGDDIDRGFSSGYTDAALTAVSNEMLAIIVDLAPVDQVLYDLITSTVDGYQRGDIDNDGDINISDTVDVLRFITGLEDYEWIRNNILGPMLADMPTYGSYFDSAILTISNDLDKINTVATDITNVNNVALNKANVDTVAGINASITTVAGISANTTTVAGISSNVTTVAGISSDVASVAADSTDIGTVAAKATEIGRLGTADAVSDMNTLAVTAIIDDMDTVAGISSDVTTVADNTTNINSAVSNASNINAVVSNATNINTVAGIDANVTTVAGVSSNVTTVAGVSGNVTTVAGISGNVTTVAGIDANVTTVAGISADVTAVAADATDIGIVSTNIADVSTVATNIADVIKETDAGNVTYDQGGTGSTITTAEAKLQETVSVKDFGATGDGTTDDSAAIQAALDHINTVGGGSVYIPTGIYNVGSSRLSIYSNTKVFGNGRTSKIIATADTGSILGILSAVGRSYIEIRDLYLDGTSGSDYAYYGVKCEACNYVRVLNITAKNFQDDCIAMGDTDYALVQGCFVGGTQTGSSGSNKSGIEYDDVCNYGIITGNICEGREIGIHIHSHPSVVAPKYTTISNNITLNQIVGTAGHIVGGILCTGLSGAEINYVTCTGNIIISDGNSKYGIYTTYTNDFIASNNLTHGTFTIGKQIVGGATNFATNHTEYVDTALHAASEADEAGKVITARRSGVPFTFVSQHESTGYAATGIDTGTGIKFKVATSASAFSDNAAIIARAKTTASAGNTPGYMTFHVTPSGSSTLSEVAKYDDNGDYYFDSGYGSAARAFGCRAFINYYAVGGTPISRKSGNITSITDHGVGDASLNFASAMVDTNYNVTIGNNLATWSGTIVSGGVRSDTSHNLTSMTTASVRLYFVYMNTTPAVGAIDLGLVSVAIFR